MSKHYTLTFEHVHMFVGIFFKKTYHFFIENMQTDQLFAKKQNLGSI